MKTPWRIVLCGLIGAIASNTQTPGTVVAVSTTTITATSGELVCVFSNRTRPEFHVECKFRGTTKLTQTATPAQASGGIVGSIHEGAEAVTWICTQPTAGVLQWDIAANGVRQSGAF